MQRIKLCTMFIVFSLGTILPVFGDWSRNVVDDQLNLSVNVDAQDINGDSQLDLLVTNFLANELVLYLNDSLSFEKFIIDGVSGGPTFAWSLDLDDNDTLDVLTMLFTEDMIVCYENNHPHWSMDTIASTTHGGDWFTLADFNNDGRQDFITVGNYAFGGRLLWFENHHPEWTMHTIDPATRQYPTAIPVDINGDGFMDVFATLMAEHRVVWFENQDSGQVWIQHSIDDAVTSPFIIHPGDFNDDGMVDAVVGSRDANYVVWYENQDSTWIQHSIDSDFAGASWGDPQDVNGDGVLDVIISGTSGDQVVWFENQHPQWTKHIIDATIYDPRLGYYVDMDGDETKDLIICGQSELVWYNNPYTSATGLQDDVSSLPYQFMLHQNHPNPFNPTTTINYYLPRISDVTLTIYDISGRAITSLTDTHQPEGAYSIQWNGTDHSGNSVSAGVYLCRLQAGEYSKTIKMVHLR